MPGTQSGFDTEKIESSNLILCEGTDDEKFISRLLRGLDIRGVQIVKLNGVDNLKNKFAAIVKLPNFHKVEKLAIILDSDSSQKDRFEKAKDRLKENGFAIPRKAFVWKKGKINVGIFLWPGSKFKSGTLEDLVLESFANTEQHKCAEVYFDCLNNQAGIKLTGSRLSKGLVRTILAGVKDLNKPELGIASEKTGVIDLNHDCFNEIKDFLKKFR